MVNGMYPSGQSKSTDEINKAKAEVFWHYSIWHYFISYKNVIISSFLCSRQDTVSTGGIRNLLLHCSECFWKV